MQTKNDLYVTRNYRHDDKAFVLSTFLRGIYYGNTFYSEIPKDIFMSHYHKILENHIQNPNVEIRVSCLKDDPEVVLGYSVLRNTNTGKPILDFVFVKKAWRGIGICKSLTPTDLYAVTHLTKAGRAIKPAHVVYNPFI